MVLHASHQHSYTKKGGEKSWIYSDAMVWSNFLFARITLNLCPQIGRIKAWVQRGSQVILALIICPPSSRVEAWAYRGSQVRHINCTRDEFRACSVTAINAVAHDIDVCPANHASKALVYRFGFRTSPVELSEARSPTSSRV
jgi:hypothetical protein